MLSFKEKLLLELKEVGMITSKMLTRRLSIAKIKYPTYYVTINRLEKQGLVKKKKQGNDLQISLTDNGRALLKQKIGAKKRHDGLASIITFDIPEEKQKARQALRRYLLRNDYILLQESLLISPNHVTAELKELIRELGIYGHVKIIAGRIEYH